MKQVYPRLKRSRPFPFPLEDCSFPRSGLSSLGLTVQPRPTASARQLSDLGWQSRSRKRKVLSRKRKLGLDLFLSGIYLFPALQNIYSIGSLASHHGPTSITYPYGTTGIIGHLSGTAVATVTTVASGSISTASPTIPIPTSSYKTRLYLLISLYWMIRGSQISLMHSGKGPISLSLHELQETAI